MPDQRKALHDEVEETRDEDIDSLIEVVQRFLHPSESDNSQQIVFEPVPPGSKAAAQIEEQRQQVLGRMRARRSEMVARAIGPAAARLGIDLHTIADGPCSWSTSGDNSEQFSCGWFDARVFRRLGMFRVRNQRVVTFETCHVSETETELIYKVRVLTPTAELEKQLTVPI